jgi:hypothetical protein
MSRRFDEQGTPVAQRLAAQAEHTEAMDTWLTCSVTAVFSVFAFRER